MKVPLRNQRNGELMRQVIGLHVRKARATHSISIASAGDFQTERCTDVERLPDRVLPYCFDFLKARALYVTGLEAVQAAPFYYLYLRRNARSLLSVPIEYGPVCGVRTADDPVFVFSPGRCGSTLLSRVLYEAEIPSVSEPDFYTQMSSYFWGSPINPASGAFRHAMWNLSADLSVVLGGPPVVKLRAECCKAPELFVRSRQARSIVLFRGFEAWARSTARVFGNSPRKAVRKYLTALRCYDKLRRSSRCHLMRYEDWMARPAEAAAELGRFLGAPIPPEAVVRAKERDSQEGTPLVGRTHRSWEVQFDAALRLWHTPRLVSARQRLEIPNVWD